MLTRGWWIRGDGNEGNEGHSLHFRQVSFSDAKAPDFMPGGFFQLIATFQTLSCRFSAHHRPEKNQCLLQFWREIRILQRKKKGQVYLQPPDQFLFSVHPQNLWVTTGSGRPRERLRARWKYSRRSRSEKVCEKRPHIRIPGQGTNQACRDPEKPPQYSRANFLRRHQGSITELYSSPISIPFTHGSYRRPTATCTW